MLQYSLSYAIPYIEVFLIVIVCSIKVSAIGRQKNYVMLQTYTVSILLLYFIGLRGFLYTDYVNYFRFYESVPTLLDGSSIKNFILESNFEKGFDFLSILIKTISPNYFFFQFVLFLIDFIILSYFLKLYCKDYFILGFAFFLVFSGLLIEINLLRNAKSIMLFFISIKYLKEKKYLKFILLNILGMLFHITAFIYILVIPFINKRYNKKLFLLFFIVGNLMFFLHFNWCTKILSFISNYMPSRLGFLIKWYIHSNEANNSISIGFLERTLTFFLLFKYTDRLVKEDCGLVFVNSLYLYLYLYLFFYELPVIPDRVGCLFVFSYWVVYPWIYKYLNKQNKILFLVIFIMYAILKLISGNRYAIQCYDNALNLKYDFEIRLDALRRYFDK